MIGQLKPEAVENFLKKQLIGHLGCSADNKIYVVPISYAYDGQYIYCHSFNGMKVEMMRRNPEVCFEVDEFVDMSNWKSVIAWGSFEELDQQEDRKKALSKLLERPLPIKSSVTTQLGNTWPFTPENLLEIPGIVFRIRLGEKTGRYEGSGSSPSLPG